ncbi:MAG: RepB family DNA primase, partial [Sphingomonadaceae bacterium]|nr:RepB family DNA primase [Sphingomonadaceae bacterium]
MGNISAKPAAEKVEELSDDGETPFGETVGFLREMRPGGRYVLSAICPNGGGIETKTFELTDADTMRSWLGRWNGKRNLYWTPNTVVRTMSRKPEEADIEQLDMLHVDVDPGKDTDWSEDRKHILAELKNYDPPPSAIVDSGNGYQGFWLLDDAPFVGGAPGRIAELKLYNVTIRDKLGGDSCQSLDHLMRLPGTKNIPNAKKQADGRIERTASVVKWPEGRAHTLADFCAGQAERGRTNSGPAVDLDEIHFLSNLDELPDSVSQRIRKVIEQGPDGDWSAYPSRNEAVLGVCCALVRAGCSNEEIAAVILDPKWRISERVIQRGGKRDAEQEITKARALVGRFRPEIIYDEDELPRVLDETEAALMNDDVPFYQMSGRLVRDVRLGKSSDEDGIRRAAGALVISDLNEHFLRERMIASARYVVLNKGKSGKIVRAKKAPPLSLAKHYAARMGMWNLPELVGVCEAPTLRSDGSAGWEEGYDLASGLIIDTQGVAFPPIPEAPTKEDAIDALDQLLDIIAEFPFEPDDANAPDNPMSPSASRSVALSMILTAVVRRSLRTAPMHGISAPTMATGKSLLADVAAMIATGREAPVISQASKEEENEKRLFASLLQGDPILAIDNIDEPVSGDALCSVLTQETWQSRLLGVSKNLRVSTKTLMVANGNNLEFRGDMATRAIVARLDARCDDPGQREFRYDLKEFVPRERPRLVAAALTVLRAYIAAGCPIEPGVKTFARFEDWSKLVRGALLWLGQSDPVETRKKIATSDVVAAALTGLHGAWQRAFGFSAWKQPSEIMEAADAEERELGRSGPLALALGAFCASPRGVNAIALGRKLSKFANRRLDGLWIEVDVNTKTANRYRLMSEELEREAASIALLIISRTNYTPKALVHFW